MAEWPTAKKAEMNNSVEIYERRKYWLNIILIYWFNSKLKRSENHQKLIIKQNKLNNQQILTLMFESDTDF